MVFGVTGVGIAPVLPMLDELLARAPRRGRVRLYWGNRDAEDLFWHDELDALQARIRASRSRCSSPATAAGVDAAQRGRITPAVLADLPRFDKPIFYLVGNGAMIRESRRSCVERGVDRKRQIRNEAFFE